MTEERPLDFEISEALATLYLALRFAERADLESNGIDDSSEETVTALAAYSICQAAAAAGTTRATQRVLAWATEAMGGDAMVLKGLAESLGGNDE